MFLATISTLLLVGALVSKDSGSGFTHASRKMVGKVAKEGDTDMLFTETTTAIATVLGTRAMED